MSRYLTLLRLRRQYAHLKAENDKTFWTIHDALSEGPDYKSRLRRTIEITRVGEEFQQAKRLFRQIGELQGRWTSA